MERPERLMVERATTLQPTLPTSQTLAETPHARLRRETASWHLAVEEALAGHDLRSRVGLAAFLKAQAAAVFALEHELDARGAGKLLPDWPNRRRSDALRADFSTLGCGLPRPVRAPVLDTTGRQLGALYVLEGSRLGGNVLAREVRRSSDETVRQATSFLDHQAGPGAWTQFRKLLNESATAAEELLQGAEQTFACFLESANSPSLNKIIG